LLAPIVAKHKDAIVRRLDLAALTKKLKLPTPSATFHGRDIFAPVAAHLAASQLSIEEIGPKTQEIVPSWVEEPSISGEQVSGVIITIDHFGNLITNIEAEQIQRFARPVVRTGGHAFPVRRTYGDVRPGEYLALINSFGVLEIARAEQSAADALGLGRGTPITVSET